jgi:hypothetical protein
LTLSSTPTGGGRHGELLKRKIDFGGRVLAPTLDAFWKHPRLAEMFPKFLLAIHGSVRATIPLMELAIEVCRRRDDPICSQLLPYFTQHIAEERGHEDWLLEDLEAIGISRDHVFGTVPHRLIAGVAGAQYYWISHVHPVALLGFFAVLEGNPPIASDLADIQEQTGMRMEAFRMLTHHAEVDKAHAAEIYALLDRLPLSPFHAELVGVSALHTLSTLEQFFDDLASSEPVHA